MRYPGIPAADEATPGHDSDPEPDARFTLAGERTFLAWMRTALAFIAGGIAAPRFIIEDGSSPVALALGAGLVVFGCAIALLSYHRWRRTDAAIRAAQPLPGSTLPTILTMAVVVGGGMAGVLLLALS